MGLSKQHVTGPCQEIVLGQYRVQDRSLHRYPKLDNHAEKTAEPGVINYERDVHKTQSLLQLSEPLHDISTLIQFRICVCTGFSFQSAVPALVWSTPGLLAPKRSGGASQGALIIYSLFNSQRCLASRALLFRGTPSLYP